MACHGLPLDPVPFPAGLYLVNHGENMVERRGNLGGKLAYLERNLVPAPEVAGIAAAFKAPAAGAIFAMEVPFRGRLAGAGPRSSARVTWRVLGRRLATAFPE